MVVRECCLLGYDLSRNTSFYILLVVWSIVLAKHIIYWLTERSHRNNYLLTVVYRTHSDPKQGIPNHNVVDPLPYSLCRGPSVGSQKHSRTRFYFITIVFSSVPKTTRCTTTLARSSLCILDIVWFTILKHHWRKIKSVLISDFYLDSMFYNAFYTIGESFSTRVLFSRCFLVVALIISFYRCEKLIKRAPGPDPIDGLLYVVAETPCRRDSLLFERLGLYFIVDSLMILGLFKPIFDLPVWS